MSQAALGAEVHRNGQRTTRSLASGVHRLIGEKDKKHANTCTNTSISETDWHSGKESTGAGRGSEKPQ